MVQTVALVTVLVSSTETCYGPMFNGKIRRVYKCQVRYNTSNEPIYVLLVSTYLIFLDLDVLGFVK